MHEEPAVEQELNTQGLHAWLQGCRRAGTHLESHVCTWVGSAPPGSLGAAWVPWWIIASGPTCRS